MSKPKGSLTQFYAVPREILSFLNTVRHEIDFAAAITIGHRNKFAYVKKSETFDFEKLADTTKDREIEILISDIDAFDELDVDSSYSFLATYPSCVVVCIGKLVPRGLTESSIGFMTDDPEKYAFGVKIASKFKKTTITGGMLLGTDTGWAEKRIKARYTSGARLLSDQGLRICPFLQQEDFVPQGNYYKLID